MKRGLFFVVFVFLLLTFCACGQPQIIIPLEFVETIPPKPESAEWFSLNYSQNEFRTEIIDRQLTISKTKEKDRCEFKLSNGTLIGINRGEFGGQLKFLPLDTTQKEIVIKGGNIEFIFPFKEKIYFIEGLAHMGYSGGALYELEITNNKFVFKKLLDFEDAPEAFTIYQDKFLIAGHESFYIIKNFKKEIILEETFWDNLYPNSIAVFDDKNVFIGIRSGIVKLDLTTKDLRFYKYQE